MQLSSTIQTIKVDSFQVKDIALSIPKQKIDTVIKGQMDALGVRGVGVAVLNEGQIEWCQNFGEFETPVLTQAASISKTVNALAVFSLIDQSNQAIKQSKPTGLKDNIVLSLDTDVSTLLEKDLWNSINRQKLLPTHHKITIRQLLSHTAGTNVSGFQGYSRVIEDTGITIPFSSKEILLGSGNSEAVQIVSLPEKQYAYSGGGTTILQNIIETLSGKSYEEVVQERVLNPLKMKNSTFHPGIGTLPPLGGYDAKGNPIPGNWHIYPELAAAGLWTTAKDIAKLTQGIQQSLLGARDSLVGLELANEMLKCQSEENFAALGLFTAKGPSTATYFWHLGGNEGFRNIMYGSSRGHGAIVLTNSNRGHELYREVLTSIAKAYNWPDAEHLPKDF